MAKLKILGSSSAGNAYILEASDETLIIELGVGWSEILRSLNYDLTKVYSCLVSHRHSDHSCAISHALKNGLDIYSCQDVQTIHPQVKVLKNGVKKQIGAFKVQPIPLYHSCECIGFLIEHEDFGKIVFATDTNEIPYRFKNCNHLIIECNYDVDVLIDHACSDMYSQSASENHLELNDTIDFIKQNYSCDIQSITLIHLSNNNINASVAKKRIVDEIGFGNVYIADVGVEVTLNKDEF